MVLLGPGTEPLLVAVQRVPGEDGHLQGAQCLVSHLGEAQERPVGLNSPQNPWTHPIGHQQDLSQIMPVVEFLSSGSHSLQKKKE